jgi:phage portal protein BeeE
MLMIVASICLRGNAFVEKLYIGSKLVSLVPLLPQNMVVKRLDSGKLQYTYTENSVKRIIPVDRMMHIRGFGLDGVCGMMPTMAGVDVFGAAMSVDEAAAKSSKMACKVPVSCLQKRRLIRNSEKDCVKTFSLLLVLKTPGN